MSQALAKGARFKGALKTSEIKMGNFLVVHPHGQVRGRGSWKGGSPAHQGENLAWVTAPLVDETVRRGNDT